MIMTTKKQISASETVSSDYVLMQVTLTLAVESYIVDDQAEQRHEAAIEEVLERFQPTYIDEIGRSINDEVIVLASKFTPLTLKVEQQ